MTRAIRKMPSCRPLTTYSTWRLLIKA